MNIRYLVATLLMSVATISPAKEIQDCDWNQPGRNPYTGTIDAALNNYDDLSPDLRDKFKRRLERREYDEVVNINKTSITGKHKYYPEITHMHFGKNHMCVNINRDKWPKFHTEPATVYCEGEECIIVPSICGNISRTKRIKQEQSGTTNSGGTGGSTPQYPQVEPYHEQQPDKINQYDKGHLPPVELLYPGPGRDFGGNWNTPPGTLLPPPILNPVPEPNALWLFLIGLVVLFLLRKKP